MTRSTRPQLPIWVTSIAVVAGLLASFPSDGVGQGVSCDSDLISGLPLPHVRISAAKAPLRVAPEPEGKIAVSLPPDISVALLEQSDGWFLVNYQDRDKYRRLYVSTMDAEGPAAASLDANQVQTQKWAIAHTRICEQIAGHRFAAKSFATAMVVAGLTTVIWRVYIEDVDHYGTAFALWSTASVASLVGTIYKSLRLTRAKRQLADLGSPTSFTGGGLMPGFGGARADLQFDAATRRLAVVAIWQR